MFADISLLRREGTSAEEFMRHPCVQVMVFPRSNGSDQSEGELVWAAVDTGADHIYIDPELAGRLNLPVVGLTHVNGAAGQPIYEGSLAIVGINDLTYVRFVHRECRPLGLPFDVVLGRILLNHLALEYSPSQQVARLRKIDPPQC